MAKKKQKKTKHPGANASILTGKMTLQDFAHLTFRERANRFQKNGSSVDSVYEGLDFDAIRAKRRITSIIHCAEEVQHRFSSICPDIPNVFSIEEDWVTMNSFPVSAFDHIEKYVCSTLGAAIWLLDHIRDHGKMDQLNEILRYAPPSGDVYLPDVWDPCHSQQMLRQMVSIINNRNKDCPVTEKAVRKNKATVTRIYMDRPTAETKIDHDVPSRRIYDQVLSLIDPEALSEIESAYEEKYWQWLRRYFLSREIFNREEQAIREEIDAFQTQMQALLAQTSGLSQSRKPISILSNASTTGALPSLDITPDPEKMNQLRVLEYQNKVLYDKQEKFNSRFGTFSREVGEFPMTPFEDIASVHGEAIARIWTDFELEDPYSMCMAFLSLLDQGSDLPWCYFPSVMLQSCYVSMLPWTRTKFISCCDEIWEHYDSKTDSVVPGPSSQPLPKKIRVPDFDDWYRLQYQDTAKSKAADKELYNLSHILYETTGCLMPRNPKRHLAALNTLNRYGINNKKANLNLLYCMSLLGEAKHQSAMSQIPVSQEPEFGLMPDTVEALQEEVAALRQELSQCRQALQDTTSQGSAGTNQILQLQRQLSYRDFLIHDLSGIVFDAKIPTASVNTSSSYRTASNFTVFTADKAWSSHMNKALPDVRIFHEITNECKEVLRSSDTVWIQPKDLSFEDYRRILSEARRSDVPIRIFPFADVASCAALLVQADICR